ncbi:MAG: hypothetical protein U0931_10620 [Vulcanimicrobiota bacterium]
MAEPEPVAAEPEPVVAEPEPVAAEPEPVVAEPEPVAAEPEPVEAVLEPAPAQVEQPLAEPQPLLAEKLTPQVAAVAQAEPESPAPSVAPPWVSGELVRPLPSHLEVWRSQPGASSDSPAELLRQAAWKLAELGHHREAVLTLARALEWEPSVGAAWLEQLLGAWTAGLEQAGQPEAALQVCQSWYELFPDQPEAARKLKELTPVPPPPSEEYVPCEDLGQALEALRAHPGNEGLINRTLALGEGRDEELLNVFRVLTRDHVDEPLHFRNFARAYLKQNKPILAVVQYQKFLVARPSADGYRELAEAYTLLKRDKNAADALRKAEELASS